MEEKNRDEEREDLQEVVENRQKEGRVGRYTRAGVADILGNIASSAILGVPLDYYSGLDSFLGILGSRGSAAGLNAVTGGPYGWWREQAYQVTNTKKRSGKIRKGLADLLAFNTFQVPVYGVAVAAGSLISDGEIDFETVGEGMKNLAIVSPIVGPAMGIIMSGVRKVMGVKPVTEGAYRDD